MDGKITLNLRDHVRFDLSDPTPLLNRWFGPLDCKMATEWYQDVASLRLPRCRGHWTRVKRG
jgi:hypothetical protein